MSDDVRYVWVAKYALTLGVVKCVVNQRLTARCPSCVVFVDWKDRGAIGVGTGEYSDTLDGAQVLAKEIAERKLKSMERRRKRVAKIARDGAKVVEGA